jgi:hypothetical protein
LIHPLPVLEYEDLLEFLLRFLPSHIDAGSTTYAAYARQMERVARRVAEYAESVLILQATGESRTEGLARVIRTDTTERVGFRAGQVFCQTRWGVRYEATADVEFAVGVNLADNIPIRAELSGFDGNVQPGDIGRWALPTGGNRKAEIDWLDGVTESAKDTFLAEVDLGFDFRQIGEISGGAWVEGKGGGDPWLGGGALATLDLLGSERGLPRLEGETDIAYRRRIRTLPDVLTPAAIERVVEAYLEGTGATFEFLEPWEYGFAFGADPEGAFGSGGPFVGFPSFTIIVSGLPYEADGFAFEVDPNGAFESGGPFGTGAVIHDGIIAGLEDLLRRIRAAGVCSAVVEGTL